MIKKLQLSPVLTKEDKVQELEKKKIGENSAAAGR